MGERQSGLDTLTDDLVKRIVHTFNNDIASITEFASFIREDLGVATPHGRYAQHILTAAASVDLLTRTIATLAQSLTEKTGVIRLYTGAAREIEHLRQDQFAGAAIELIAREQDLNVRVAERSFGHMLSCLIANALEATDADAAGVVVRVDPIDQAGLDSLSAMDAQDAWASVAVGQVDPVAVYGCLTVRDFGRGIAAELLPQIFMPFVTTKPRNRTSGLGLALLHQAVLANDGYCRISTRPGVGTAARLCLKAPSRPA